jgi:hypothetical protein
MTNVYFFSYQYQLKIAGSKRKNISTEITFRNNYQLFFQSILFWIFCKALFPLLL